VRGFGSEAGAGATEALGPAVHGIGPSEEAIGCPAALAFDEVAATAGWTASVQLRDGMVPWYQGGHADPWNHTEALMALATAGMWPEVERGFAWLERNQLDDGSWCSAYLQDGILDPRRDPNVCAYVATGAWWCSRVGPGTAILEALWPMVERAVEWCLARQLASGEVVWSVGPDGVPGAFALLAANSSVQHSLRCAVLVAEALGHDRPHWAAAAAGVASAVRRGPGGFAPKERWAMDWYYPVLTGAVQGEGARAQMGARWHELVEPGLGVRCVADKLWVTAAETAECSIAAEVAGMHEQASALLAWTRHLRHEAGGYWTGCAHPDCTKFPGGQVSTYSAAAVVIADHVLHRRSPAAAVFVPGPS